MQLNSPGAARDGGPVVLRPVRVTPCFDWHQCLFFWEGKGHTVIFISGDTLCVIITCRMFSTWIVSLLIALAKFADSDSTAQTVAFWRRWVRSHLLLIHSECSLFITCLHLMLMYCSLKGVDCVGSKFTIANWQVKSPLSRGFCYCVAQYYVQSS